MFWFLIGAACVAVTVLLSGVGNSPWRAGDAQAMPGGLTHPKYVVARAQPAEGRFEYRKFPLRESEWLLPDTSVPLGAPAWWIGNTTRRQYLDFLSTCELSEQERRQLEDWGRWEATTNGVWVRPKMEVVVGLSPASRARIYSMLAAYPANRSQCHPFRFNPANFEPWLRETGLEPDEAERFRRLTYTQEDVVCFSDGNILQANLSPEKFRQLVRALQSEPTFLMSLQVDEGMDIEPLISYWGRGREAQRMRPLLESLTQIPGGGSVNVSYLLPPFARLRLYTYDNSPDSCSRRYNCSWTALNFFNETPDERFADFDRAMEYLGRRYQAVTSPPQFGDVMVVEESSGRPLHFCVFLADGVVFTKNGFDYLEPWVLMKVPEMLAYFHGTKGTKTVVYRPAKG